MKGLFQIVVVNEVNCLGQNSQPFVIGNILETQRHRPEEARLFDEDQKWIFLAVKFSFFRPKYMPVVAPNQTDQLDYYYY